MGIIRLIAHWVFLISAFDKKDGPLTEEENEQYHLAKEKMLGNIKFIGQFTILPSFVFLLLIAFI